MRHYKYISIGSLWILTFGSLLCSPAVSGETTSRVWVVGDAQSIEYDPSTWDVVRRIEIPENFFRNPDGLQISRSGAMIFSPDPYTISGVSTNGSESGKVWLWDGSTSSSLDLGCIREIVSSVECRESIHESCPRIALSSDGQKLFWFANEFERVKQVDGPDISVSTTFRVWQTDLSGSDPVQLGNFSFPPCSCETGVCMETCPKAEFWFRPDGIDDFFIVQHFIEGQLESTSLDSFIYRKSGEEWSSSGFDQDFDTILDTDAGGDTVVCAIRDSGCCGWDNDSSDRTILSSKGIIRSIFDEREKFSNSNYDVSFYTSKARLSPDGSHIAVNTASTQRESDAIRLSSTGRENSNELARIQAAIKAMPSVEVIQTSGSDTPLVSIPNASLAGWLNIQEVLVVREGVLVRCDISTNGCRNTPVAVKKDSIIFIR
ncbi:MAG: hypothetical protein P8Y80_13995 [Acidobacteriota bacterium]|jgi:hypothetical protein